MIRRAFTAAVAVMLATTPALAGPVARTALGPVDGLVLDNGVQAWLGIPYAAPPVGELRWKPPQPATPWTGTLPATRFMPSCMQPLRDHGIAYYVGDDPVAEDCLTLNIWAPKGVAQGAKLPVIVFIHGGSFVAGSARKPLYVGDKLAAKGAVVVSINYRLGVLGFLALPELTRESPDHASGNYGLMDQIAALRWVRDNIGAFGGDASRVTLMGQSAGAIAIALLQTSPAAHGLFHRIAALSGSPYSSATTDRVQGLAAAEQHGDLFRQKLGAQDLAALRRMPADRLIAAQPGLVLPIVDGVVIPTSPATAYARHQAADVPLLLGTVRDEALGSLASVTGLATYRAAVELLSPTHAAAVLHLYPARTDAEARDAARALDHDIGFSTMMRGWARMQRANGSASVHAYQFDQRHPYTPGVTFSDLDPATTGVNHTDDLPYWLGTFDSLNGPRTTRDWTAQDRALGDRMQAALVAFAGSGDPGAPWPSYDPKSERVMRLGGPEQVTRWADTTRIDALAALGIPVSTPATGNGR